MPASVIYHRKQEVSVTIRLFTFDRVNLLIIHAHLRRQVTIRFRHRPAV